MNLIESSFDVTTAKRASDHPVFNVSYPGYVVLIIYEEIMQPVSSTSHYATAGTVSDYRHEQS